MEIDKQIIITIIISLIIRIIIISAERVVKKIIKYLDNIGLTKHTSRVGQQTV